MALFASKKHKSTKKFFWAITTQTELFVSGYLRQQLLPFSNALIAPDSIKLLISKFSSTMFVDTKILKFSEIDSMLSLLSTQWKEKTIHLELIHRGSEHDLNVVSLVRNVLTDLDEYVVLFHTSHDHVFGVYKPFNTMDTCNEGFEFVVRSKFQYLPKVFGKSWHWKKKKFPAYAQDDRFNDLRLISQNCTLLFPNEDVHSAFCVGKIGLSTNELCGGNDAHGSQYAFEFGVLDYEVYTRLSGDVPFGKTFQLLDLDEVVRKSVADQ